MSAMKKTIRQDKSKGDLIRSILQNPVYSEDAGVIKQLGKTLGKMSLSDLANLRLILDLKSKQEMP